MPRSPRIDIADIPYHVINRANERKTIFHNKADYEDFEYLLFETREIYNMRILAYVIMPNHWHLLLYPSEDGTLSRTLQWLGTTHACRHHARKNTIGNGHLYQGRYKSFPVQEDHHFLTVLKYIERNPVRAQLVKTPDKWRWGSAFLRLHGGKQQKEMITEPPVSLPGNYKDWISEPNPSEELDMVRNSVNKGIPYGEINIIP